MKRKSGYFNGKIVSFIAGVIVASILFGAAVVLVYYLRGINETEVELSLNNSEVPKPIIKEIKVRDPLPSRHVDYKSIDTARLWSGVESNTKIEIQEGKEASYERKQKSSYSFDFTIRLNKPKPVENLEGLNLMNPSIGKILPGLSELFTDSRVSGFYYKLYEIKSKRLQQYLTRLNAIPDKHNFYDCETILEMTYPSSGRKILFIQSEMDVVSDGSDGDRMPEYDKYIAESTNYQPFTSYGWKKKTDRPNPLLKRWSEKLTESEKKLINGGLRSSQKTALEQTISKLKREIADMKARSFLIARADPFIVIPSWMRSYVNQNDFAPSVGDYVAVIYNDSIYPAIIGDTGPTWKIGEASLRLAKELNPKATSYSRPVSDLKVSYVVFPGTASKPNAPDLDDWNKVVNKLLKEIGGVGNDYLLHSWENYFK